MMKSIAILAPSIFLLSGCEAIRLNFNGTQGRYFFVQETFWHADSDYGYWLTEDEGYIKLSYDSPGGVADVSLKFYLNSGEKRSDNVQYGVETVCPSIQAQSYEIVLEDGSIADTKNIECTQNIDYHVGVYNSPVYNLTSYNATHRNLELRLEFNAPAKRDPIPLLKARVEYPEDLPLPREDQFHLDYVITVPCLASPRKAYFGNPLYNKVSNNEADNDRGYPVIPEKTITDEDDCSLKAGIDNYVLTKSSTEATLLVGFLNGTEQLDPIPSCCYNF